MEPQSQEPKPIGGISRKTNRYLLIVGVVILFSIPLVLIFFKPSGDAANKAGVATPANITTLENQVKANPSYANLVNLSVAYVNSNQPSKAISYLKEALKKNPKSAIAYNNLGVVHIMLKNYETAIENCQKSISLDTGFALAKNNLKWATDEKNKVLISLQEMARIPEDKRDISFYIDAGIKYLSVGDYEDCIAVCYRGLGKDPGNIVLLNNSGTALMMQKKYEGAIVEFQKILEKDAGNQLAKNNMAWAMDEKKMNH